MGSQTFSYTGADQTFVVPAGVTTITVDCQGAEGAANQAGTVLGGKGGRVVCDLTVTPGETLHITVGQHLTTKAATYPDGGAGGGTGVADAGGGGGSSDVRQGGSGTGNRVVVAGGGGGAGGNGSTNVGGVGAGGNGGAGALGSGTTAGGGGTGSSGGSAGSGGGGGPSGTAGASAQGGAGGNATRGGGGGGGGLFGGGGGGAGGSPGNEGSGGGGGSGLGTGVNQTLTSGFRSGNGQVILTWVAVVAAADVATVGAAAIDATVSIQSPSPLAGVASIAAAALAPTVSTQSDVNAAAGVASIAAGGFGATAKVNPSAGIAGIAGSAADATTVTLVAVELVGAITDAVVFGPAFIDVEGFDLAPLALEVVDATALSTVVDTLDGRHSANFRDQENDTGAGSVAYQNDDAAAVAAVEMDMLVNFIVYGVRAWTMLVEQMHRSRITEGEESEQFTVVSGRGHLAMWEDAVVYPARGSDSLPIEEDRVYNWTSPVFDDSAWGTATSIGRQDGSFAYWTGLPSIDWPDASAEWIWAARQDPSFPALDQWSPDGTCYFRHGFTVPAGIHKLHIYFTADAVGRLYIDGAQIAENTASLGGSGDPTTMSEVYVDVSPGERLFAVSLTNDVDPEGDMVQNPGGFLLAIYSATQEGNDITLLDHSDSSWLIVEYADHPPGMKVGEVIRVAHDEAKARGVLTAWTLGFSDDLDSAGVPWPEVTDISTKVGTNYLTFLKELTVTYVDVWARPGQLILDAWVRGTHGSDTDVSLHGPTDPDDESTGNLYELSHTIVS